MGTKRWSEEISYEMWGEGGGAEGQTRTVDTGIFSAVLYHLSYLGSSVYPSAPVRPLGPFLILSEILERKTRFELATPSLQGRGFSQQTEINGGTRPGFRPSPWQERCPSQAGPISKFYPGLNRTRAPISQL